MYDEILYTNLLIYNGMASVTFIASQARSIYQHRNLRIKVPKCCTDIVFNLLAPELFF